MSKYVFATILLALIVINSVAGKFIMNDDDNDDDIDEFMQRRFTVEDLFDALVAKHMQERHLSFPSTYQSHNYDSSFSSDTSSSGDGGDGGDEEDWPSYFSRPSDTQSSGSRSSGSRGSGHGSSSSSSSSSSKRGNNLQNNREYHVRREFDDNFRRRFFQ